MKTLALLIAFAFASLVGYSESLDTIHRQINAIQADSLISANAGNPDFIILDVRTPGEFNGGHILDAVNINYYDADFSLQLDALDTNNTYLVYCQSGARSYQAYTMMRNKGFLHLHNLISGLNSWVNNGFPTYNGATVIIELRHTDINIYPNPATDQIFFSGTELLIQPQIAVIDLDGKTVFCTPLSDQSLDVTTIQNGTYLVKILSKNQPVQTRILQIFR
jgi:rhodanese-related sulfurtransferase